MIEVADDRDDYNKRRGFVMTIEQPTFPTPEDERRASVLWQAVRELADADNDRPTNGAPGAAKPVEAGLSQK